VVPRPISSLGLALGLVLGLGCRGTPPSPPSSEKPRDLGAERRLACAGLQDCVDACPPSSEACADACTRRLRPESRAWYEALQACVVPACARADAALAPCKHEPSSWACKICVMRNCASAASACMVH
jgi:hypothetical protein